MKTDTADKIIGFVKQNNQASAKQITEYLGISRQAVFRHLKTLLEQNKLGKIGSAPKVFYFLTGKKLVEKNVGIDEALAEIIEQNYLIINAQGEKLTGLAGFIYWCNRNDLPIEKTAAEYVKVIKKYQDFKKSGLIDGMQKMNATFDQVYVDELYYLDFYSIERFGKTKLGSLLLYAKQSQNKTLIKEIYILIKNRLLQIIKNKNIDALAFIPPTVQRKIQLQKELEKLIEADTDLPKIKLIKVTKEIAVPQKSLSKLEDRIENARQTIFVDDDKQFKNILLIDDAVGSGATINETARKLREKNICQEKIIGLALTGSFKGFDIISEV